MPLLRRRFFEHLKLSVSHLFQHSELVKLRQKLIDTFLTHLNGEPALIRNLGINSLANRNFLVDFENNAVISATSVPSKVEEAM